MDTICRSFAFLAAGILVVAMAALAPPAVGSGANEAGFDAAHRVMFRSGATPSDKLNFNAPHHEIAGYLYKPDGAGPFPAVVLAPETEGLHPVQKAWALRLVQWGYVALAVDHRSRSGSWQASAITTAHDAYGALRHLAGLPFVDVQRIAWIGWYTGGGDAVVRSGAMEAHPQDPEKPTSLFVSEGAWRFRAAIAFYPSCPGVGKTYYAPMLMLVPGKDPRYLDKCRETAEQSTAGGAPVRFKLYPEATPLFDMEGVKADLFGEPAQYDSSAAKDAIAEVKAFLTVHLKGG